MKPGKLMRLSLIVIPVLLSGCASFQYGVNPAPTTNKPTVCPSPDVKDHELTSDFFTAFNHVEGQFAYGLNNNHALAFNGYFGKYKMAELGWTWFFWNKDNFRAGLQLGGGIGNQNIQAEYEKGGLFNSPLWHKTFDASNRFSKISIQPFVNYKLDDNISVQFGSRLSYFNYSRFNYFFHEQYTETYSTSSYYPTVVVHHEQIDNRSLNFWRIDPYFTLRYDWFFLQLQLPVICRSQEFIRTYHLQESSYLLAMGVSFNFLSGKAD